MSEDNFGSMSHALEDLCILLGIHVHGVVQWERRCVYGADRALLGQRAICEERTHSLHGTDRWQRQRALLFAVAYVVIQILSYNHDYYLIRLIHMEKAMETFEGTIEDYYILILHHYLF